MWGLNSSKGRNPGANGGQTVPPGGEGLGEDALPTPVTCGEWKEFQRAARYELSCRSLLDKNCACLTLGFRFQYGLAVMEAILVSIISRRLQSTTPVSVQIIQASFTSDANIALLICLSSRLAGMNKEMSLNKFLQLFNNIIFFNKLPYICSHK